MNLATLINGRIIDAIFLTRTTDFSTGSGSGAIALSTLYPIVQRGYFLVIFGVSMRADNGGTPKARVLFGVGGRGWHAGAGATSTLSQSVAAVERSQTYEVGSGTIEVALSIARIGGVGSLAICNPVSDPGTDAMSTLILFVATQDPNE